MGFRAFRFAIACAALAAMLPLRARAADTGVVAVAPFTLSHGHIFVAVRINGRPATLVLDSGASSEVIEAKSARRLGIAAPAGGKSITVTGTGGTAPARRARIASLQVGSVLVADTPAYVLSLPGLENCDGLLGYEFLRRFVTTLDFDSGLMTLRRPGAAPPGQWVLPFALTEDIPWVNGEAGGWRGRFKIDTGYGGTLVLNTPFVEKYRLRDRYARSGAANGRGIGGATQGDFVRLDSFQMGQVPLDGVVAELSLQKLGAFSNPRDAGTVGLEILSRFTITLDYPGSRMILTARGR